MTTNSNGRATVTISNTSGLSGKMKTLKNGDDCWEVYARLSFFGERAQEAKKAFETGAPLSFTGKTKVSSYTPPNGNERQTLDIMATTIVHEGP